MGKNVPLQIAFRYLIAKKGSTAVTFITWLAVLAMTVATAAMFIILSVFSGLEDLNRDLIKDVHSDLTIKPSSGKLLKSPETVHQILKQQPQVSAFSDVIEEKVYLDFQGKGDIAYLRGVDPQYLQVNPLQNSIIAGTYPSFKYENEVVMEMLLMDRLGIVPGSDLFATLYMPKAGEGLVTKEQDIFNKKEVYVTGAVNGKDQLNNYLIGPIELSRDLLQLPAGAVYQIVIALKDESQTESIQRELQSKLGKGYIVRTKAEENSAFWKMINVEKLFIYLIFALVIFITTFNLAGAIIILQLDKKSQAKSLVSLGFGQWELRRVYFYTGLLIVLVGISAGLVLGTIISFIQIRSGIFMASANLPFPVRITLWNYLMVFATAGAFGSFVAWLASRSRQRSM